MSRKVYQRVGGLDPRRSVFDISYSKLYDCDMGQLIPVFAKECIPGDRHQISMEAVVRFQPLIAPVLHEIYLRTFYFFVPSRLIYSEEEDFDFEDFITGGEDGNDDQELPLWMDDDGVTLYQPSTKPLNGKYSLWDYFSLELQNPHLSAHPTDQYKRAYNLCFNEYFRDQNLMEEVSLHQNSIKNICWRKDRFTSALYDTQRGDRPAIPLQGLTSVSFNGATVAGGEVLAFGVMAGSSGPVIGSAGMTTGGNLTSQTYIGGNPPAMGNISNPPVDLQAGLQFKNWLNNNSLNMSQAVTFDVIDMRRIFQLQRYMERNMRSGSRYTEVLRARYGERPQDQRLQRPEYIGGTRSPIIVSEVLQTSSTDSTSPQGNLAGHAITAESSRVGTYHAREHGYIIGVAVIQPKAIYQHGIPRELLRRTRYDFPTPELVNLSETAVYNAEVCVTGNQSDFEIFGFQGIYDEMRVSESQIVAGMRDEFSYWHLARDDYSPSSPPSLNANFVECRPSKRIFADHITPGCIVHYGNRVRSVRPLPITAEPGLIDHH